VNKNEDFIYYHASETKVNIKQLLMLTHSLSISVISYCVYLTTKNWPEYEVKVKGKRYGVLYASARNKTSVIQPDCITTLLCKVLVHMNRYMTHLT